MNPRASVPKIFLRGNRYYVRVQVPLSMQDRLGRRECWVSLRTSDRSDAIQRAATATQRKRHEMVSAFRLLGHATEAPVGRVDDLIKAAMSGTGTDHAIGMVVPGADGRWGNIATDRVLEVHISHSSRSSAKTGRANAPPKGWLFGQLTWTHSIDPLPGQTGKEATSGSPALQNTRVEGVLPALRRSSRPEMGTAPAPAGST